MIMLLFLIFSSKSRKIGVQKRSLNRLIVLVSFINGDLLSDLSKSKAQTAGRQEPRATLQILFTKINYFAKKKNEEEEEEERTPVFLHYRMDRALRATMAMSLSL